MKKMLSLIYIMFLLVGCSISNNPNSKVDEFLTKYQMLDKDISSGIEDVVNSENLTDEQKNRYRKILEKQYKNMFYEIKDTKIDGVNASVTVELEVYDYKKAINETLDKYLGKDDYTVLEYNNDKLNKLENVKDKVKYTIYLNLKKENDTWKILNLSNETIKKIEGMY